jgi:O-antigen/teichoic acid export membrane protein
MNGLLGLSRNRVRATILLSNAVLSLVLYVALIPTFSWRGAVAATLIVESTLFVSAWVALAACQRRATDAGAIAAVAATPRAPLDTAAAGASAEAASPREGV